MLASRPLDQVYSFTRRLRLRTCACAAGCMPLVDGQHREFDALGYKLSIRADLVPCGDMKWGGHGGTGITSGTVWQLSWFLQQPHECPFASQAKACQLPAWVPTLRFSTERYWTVSDLRDSLKAINEVPTMVFVAHTFGSLRKPNGTVVSVSGYERKVFDSNTGAQTSQSLDSVEAVYEQMREDLGIDLSLDDPTGEHTLSPKPARKPPAKPSGWNSSSVAKALLAAAGFCTVALVLRLAFRRR